MEKLKSRKLWMAIVSALLMVANQGLDLKIPTESVLSIAGVVMAYIFGQSYVDGKQSVQQLAHQIITNAQPEPLEDSEPIEEPNAVEDVNKQAIQQPILDGRAQAQPEVQVQPVAQPLQPQVQQQAEAERLAKIADLQRQIDELKAPIQAN